MLFDMRNTSKSTKRERFERLGVYRTNEALKKLKILSHCANRSAYEYSESDVNKIFAEVEKAVKEAKSKFHFPASKKHFSL